MNAPEYNKWVVRMAGTLGIGYGTAAAILLETEKTELGNLIANSYPELTTDGFLRKVREEDNTLLRYLKNALSDEEYSSLIRTVNRNDLYDPVTAADVRPWHGKLNDWVDSQIDLTRDHLMDIILPIVCFLCALFTISLPIFSYMKVRSCGYDGQTTFAVTA